MAPQQGYEDVARVLRGPVTETVVHDDQRWCRYIVHQGRMRVLLAALYGG
jgi:hypothetical protein